MILGSVLYNVGFSQVRETGVRRPWKLMFGIQMMMVGVMVTLNGISTFLSSSNKTALGAGDAYKIAPATSSEVKAQGKETILSKQEDEGAKGGVEHVTEKPGNNKQLRHGT